MAKEVKGSHPHPCYASPVWFGIKCPFLLVQYHHPGIEGEKKKYHFGSWEGVRREEASMRQK